MTKRLLPLLILLPNVFFALYVAYRIIAIDGLPDLYIYRAGSSLGWQGQSPYSDKITDEVRTKYPENADLIKNCGYFLPPQAIVLGGPFAALPWSVAQVMYGILCIAGSFVCWYGLTFAFRNRPAPSLQDVPPVLPWLFMLHHVVWATFAVGQTTIIMVAAIVLGQIFHERRWPVLGAFLWAGAFIKPHLALPLIPLAFYLSGWKRGAFVIGWLIVLNLAGCLLAGSSPLFAFEYLDHLAGNHKKIEFNRVDLNPQITSWNRLLVVAKGPVIELDLKLTLAGYAVMAMLVVARCTLARRWPSKTWLLAIAAVAMIFCCQVLAYESLLLVLVLPHLFENYAKGHKVDATVFAIAFVVLMVPLDPMSNLGLEFYRPLVTALMAIWLLVRPGFVEKSMNGGTPVPERTPVRVDVRAQT